MANILILGGGFGGVVAAELLARSVGDRHRITLVSRSRRFIFYPALVRLAFGEVSPDDISYDLRAAMRARGIGFMEATVAHVDTRRRSVMLGGGDIVGEMNYDYLIYALGRRVATERVPGFFEHAHHLLGVEAALRFGEAARGFRKGHAVIGSCPGARLEVPVYESAFALARLMASRRRRARITVVSPDFPEQRLGGMDFALAVAPALEKYGIELLSAFPIERVNSEFVRASDGRELEHDLLMLIPPFEGTSALAGTGLTDEEGFVRVDHTMRMLGANRAYAVGDAVYFSGPKMGHMAVKQAEVAAANLLAELAGLEPTVTYNHEMKLIVDAGGSSSAYLHKKLWDEEEKRVSWGRFWGWAKRAHETNWQYTHM